MKNMQKIFLFILIGVSSLFARLDKRIDLYRKFDQNIDKLHREILNLNREKDQILLSKDYAKTSKRLEVEKIVNEVNNVRYNILRLTKRMQNLNVSGVSAP